MQKSAEKRGLRVIIAGAGGAAHLPWNGNLMTELPVIGVPLGFKFRRMDSFIINCFKCQEEEFPLQQFAINGGKKYWNFSCSK